MIEVGVRELKNRLSEHLRRVKAGEDVVVTEHGRPVAKLVRRPARPAWLEGMIARGEATGDGSRAILGTRIRLRGKGPSAQEILRNSRGRYGSFERPCYSSSACGSPKPPPARSPRPGRPTKCAKAMARFTTGIDLFCPFRRTS